MRTLKRFLKRLTSWASRQQDEHRLQAEIEEHLALQTADNIRSGLSPAEARRQAVLKFGAVEALKESYREQRGLPFVETLIRDTRYSLRRLRMTPAFTVTAVLTLALGIGATTSIFTLAHAVLMKSLAVANPGELYRLGKEARCCYWGGYSQEKEFSLVSYNLYKHLRDNTEGFAELAAFRASQQLFGVRRVDSPDAAQGYPGEFVSGNYFTAPDWFAIPAMMRTTVSTPAVLGLLNGQLVTVPHRVLQTQHIIKSYYEKKQRSLRSRALAKDEKPWRQPKPTPGGEPINLQREEREHPSAFVFRWPSCLGC